jgi:hypothetical protein
MGLSAITRFGVQDFHVCNYPGRMAGTANQSFVFSIKRLALVHAVFEEIGNPRIGIISAMLHANTRE